MARATREILDRLVAAVTELCGAVIELAEALEDREQPKGTTPRRRLRKRRNRLWGSQ